MSVDGRKPFGKRPINAIIYILQQQGFDMKKSCIYRSVWDGGFALETAGEVDLKSGEVFTESADVDHLDLEICEREEIEFMVGDDCVTFSCGFDDDNCLMVDYDELSGLWDAAECLGVEVRS